MSSPRPLRSLFPGRPPSAPLLTASSAADTAALWFRAQFRIRSFWWTDGPPFAAIVSFGVSHHGPQCLSSEFWTVFHWRWRKGVKTKQREKRTEEIWYYKVNSIDFFKFCFVGGGGELLLKWVKSRNDCSVFTRAQWQIPRRWAQHEWRRRPSPKQRRWCGQKSTEKVPLGFGRKVPAHWTFRRKFQLPFPDLFAGSAELRWATPDAHLARPGSIKITHTIDVFWFIISDKNW